MTFFLLQVPVLPLLLPLSPGKGYRTFNHDQKQLINKIKDGLVEAALSTQAWMITSGVDNVSCYSYSVA